MAANPENLVKISPVNSEVFGGMRKFLLYCSKILGSTLVISDVTGPSLTKFVYSLEKSLPLNILKSEFVILQFVLERQCDE